MRLCPCLLFLVLAIVTHPVVTSGASPDAQAYPTVSPLPLGAPSAVEKWLKENQQGGTEDLAAAALAAKDDFSPITEEDLAKLRAQVIKAINDVTPLLAEMDQPDQWKQRLEDLRAQLAADEPDLFALRALLKAVRVDEKGVEQDAFRNLRQSLRNYFWAAGYQAEENFQDLYQSALDQIAELLREYRTSPTEETGYRIGNLLESLKLMGQAGDLVFKIRRRYSKPNLYVSVSERYVAAGGSEEVDEPVEAHEWILDTEVFAQGRVYGRAEPFLVPNNYYALIGVAFSGTSYTDSVGYNGPLTIYSHSATDVRSRASVRLDADGLTPFAAKAQACAHSTIDDVCAKCYVVEKIGRHAAEERKDEADAVASEKASVRAAQRMTRRVHEQVEEAHEDYEEKFINRLLRRDAFPTELSYSTSEQYLNVSVLQANRQRLGAPDEPPEEINGHDLTLRIHKSFVRNFAADWIADRELTDERVAQLAVERGLENAEDFAVDPERRWTMLFDEDTPVSAEFQDQTVRFTIYLAEINRNEGELVLPNVRISALYDITGREDGPHFVRRGAVEIEGVDNVVYETTIRRKFERLFTEELDIRKIAPQEGELADAGPLCLQRAAAQGGWLSVGYDMVETAAGRP